MYIFIYIYVIIQIKKIAKTKKVSVLEVGKYLGGDGHMQTKGSWMDGCHQQRSHPIQSTRHQSLRLRRVRRGRPEGTGTRRGRWEMCNTWTSLEK